MNSLDTLIKARGTYGQAKESLEQALQKVREDYPWLQIDIREDVHRDEAVIPLKDGGIPVEQPEDVLRDILEELKAIRKQTNTSVYTGTIGVQRKDVQLEQPKDLPWTEWQEGDIVEFVGKDMDFTTGKQYLIGKYIRTGNLYINGDDGDERYLESWHNDFKWISRGEDK